VFLQDIADLRKLLVALGKDVFHGRKVALLVLGAVDGLWGPDAGDHVLALGIHQILAVEVVLAGRRVAGKGDAGGAIVPHVAEHHGLDIDGRSPVRRDVVQPAVGNCALVHPGAEYRADGAP